MITVRVLFVGLLIGSAAYIVYMLNKVAEMDPTTSTVTTAGSWSFSGSIDITGILWLAILGSCVGWFLLVSYMSAALRKFAIANGFRLTPQTKTDIDMTHVPSFRPGLIFWQVAPIYGQIELMKFALFTLSYKEGGILRWRERKMDTVLALELPKPMPHIIVDAHANEKTRKSNLVRGVDSSWRFQFEGVQGAHFDVYAHPEDRITTLQLFTPDVLDVLYSRLPSTDIEVKDNVLWLLQRYQVLDDTSARELAESAEELYQQIMKQIPVMNPNPT